MVPQTMDIKTEPCIEKNVLKEKDVIRVAEVIVVNKYKVKVNYVTTI